MAITIAGYSFDGPYSSTNSLEDRSGVYAILCKKNNDKHSLVDVGESATVKTRVETHDRKACWNRNCNSSLTVAVLYTPHLQQSGRIDIEQKIRAQYDLPCGNR
jgi:hypothetical protein